LPNVTNEKRLADTIGNALDSLSFRPELTVFAFHDKGTAINMRLFDLIMAFLTNWSDRYRDNEVTPDMKMYRACEMSYRMLSALYHSE
jgi:hypothetical protein